MGQIKRVVDLVGTLQDVRRRCDVALRDRSDPAKVLGQVGPMLDAADGDVHMVRGLAPGLGDLWDTLRAVIKLARESAEWGSPPGEGSGDEGLSAAARRTPSVGGTVPGGGADEFDPDEPVDPTD